MNARHGNVPCLSVSRRRSTAWLRLHGSTDPNVLTPESVEELIRALDEVRVDASVRVVVLSGTGSVFCAGADLTCLSRNSNGQKAEEAIRFIARASRLMRQIEIMPKPVIAAVNGLAAAEGLELVLACDLVIAARSAKLGDAHANLGLLPGAGASWRLVRKVGPNRAHLLFFTGDIVSAEDMAAAGLVNRVVDDDQLESSVEELAEQLASKSPLGLARMKRLARECLDLSADTANEAEQALSREHALSRDRDEGLAAFIEKRRPEFEGR